MSTTIFPLIFLIAAVLILAAVSAFGLSRRMRKRSEKWLIPMLTALAVVCLAAFVFYIFSAAGNLPAG